MEPSEGEPPAPIAWNDSSLRERLQTQKKRKLTREAEDAGVPEDQIDEAEDSSDPKAALIELIVVATRAKALSSAPPVDGIISMEPEPEPMPVRHDDATASHRPDSGGSGGGAARVSRVPRHVTGGKLPGNIKDRLDGGEWNQPAVLEQFTRSHSSWWQTDMAEQVNRLRAAARIRDSLPDSTQQEIPDLYPQLVVLGDGNSGKSTVLNRFAEFTFTPVSDGVCTRRPVRLELRPVQARNRERMQREQLLAMGTLVDKADGHKESFELRKSHREEDEGKLRKAVESRASKKVEQANTAKKFDMQYIEEELVIRIEAEGMIYFDLLDLPGIDNLSTKPTKMANTYINEGTLTRTFVLIFSAHKKGDTAMMHALCFAILKTLSDEVGDDVYEEFITNRCLGVLTKVDKELESNSDKGPAAYNEEVVEKLRHSLACTETPDHMHKWPWVAVLNPNPNEQEQVSSHASLIDVLSVSTQT
jgi:GTPase SAR1 family protein